MTGLRPSLLFKAMKKRTLSIFVDESGILNESEQISRYYVLTLLLHDQDFKIDKLVRELDRSLDSVGIANLCFHAGPIIRANESFEFMNWDLRRKIFSRMMSFARKVDFRYHCLTIDKHFTDGLDKMTSKLNEQLTAFVDGQTGVLRGFDDVKIYYDCGQKQITNMLHRFFESRKDIPVRFAQAVEPRKYKLFQLADLACTIKLLELKLKTEGRLAPCERRFFGGEKKFIHDILRRMKAKEI